MSGSEGGGPNRTVFRPSPLQGLNQGQGFAPAPVPAPSGWDAPPPSFAPPPPAPAFTPPPAFPSGPADRLRDDDIPLPATPPAVRNRLLAEAGPVLALAASVRTGRARIPMPELHRQASNAISSFDRAVAGHYNDETRQRAKYALCATLDDIAQNLPGTGIDGAEWARRSLVVLFFQENIGGDRFWQLVDDMLRDPARNAEVIELFHACLAAGFEGRFRVMPDGKRRLHEIMSRLYGALEHPRSLSTQQLVARWKGETVPLKKVGLWSHVALAAAVAAGLLLLIYIVLRLLLMSSGSAAWDAVAGINPDEPLRLSRSAAPPPEPPASGQAEGLRQFLAPEIQQGLVTVEEDGATVRVRTTVGQLFGSGSDVLEPGREGLFRRIGEAIEKEPGRVTVEGHSDSDQLSGNLSFPDNMSLSRARADQVAAIIAGQLSDPGRVIAEGYGESRPIASNDTADGKSLNRRVEITVPRRN
jgi:type VI secretion system protein ImpK